MSLVNDALRKARVEAARQEARRSGAILPTLGQVRGERTPEIATPRTVILIALAVVAATVVWFVWSRGGADAPAGISELPASDRQGAPSSQAAADLAADRQPAGVARSSPAAPGEAKGGPTPAATREASARQPEPRLSSRSADRQPLSPPEDVRVPSSASETSTNDADPTFSGAASSAAPGTDSQPQREEPVQHRQPPPAAAEATTATASAPRPDTATASDSDLEGGARATSAGAAGTIAADAGEAAEKQPTASADPALESFRREATLPGVGVFRLDGIAWSSDRPFALINGQVVGPGGFVDGATVAEVAPDRVVLERDSRRFEIKLR